MRAQKICSETQDGLRRRGWLVGLGLVVAGSVATAGCGTGKDLFTRLAEARRLAADLRVQLTKAADASNRSVMADTDESSIAFAAEAEEAKKAVHHGRDALVPLLDALDYRAEAQMLAEFSASFAEYESLDRTILQLAVENTNVKAQKLAFGPARDAANAFRKQLDTIGLDSSPKTSCRVCPLVYAAVVAVREMQVLQSPHIAEADDAAMTMMETEMDGLETSARSALRELSALTEAGAGDRVTAATASLDRFKDTHVKIVALSRKNTNVRSLAMSLGQKYALTTACERSLAALQNELAKRGLSATR
jgi:hypothetical protein